MQPLDIRTQNIRCFRDFCPSKAHFNIRITNNPSYTVKAQPVAAQVQRREINLERLRRHSSWNSIRSPAHSSWNSVRNPAEGALNYWVTNPLFQTEVVQTKSQMWQQPLGGRSGKLEVYVHLGYAASSRLSGATQQKGEGMDRWTWGKKEAWGREEKQWNEMKPRREEEEAKRNVTGGSESGRHCRDFQVLVWM